MDNFDSKLYLEAHITIDPLFGDQLDAVKTLAESFGFKVAELLMKKREEDTPEISMYDTFITGHAKNFYILSLRTVNLIVALKQRGFKVRRYKIEDTLLDSRTEDVYSLLENKDGV